MFTKYSDETDFASEMVAQMEDLLPEQQVQVEEPALVPAPVINIAEVVEELTKCADALDEAKHPMVDEVDEALTFIGAEFLTSAD